MKRLSTVLLVVLGCGGVSEARVGALEAQVGELKAAEGTAPDAGKVDALSERLNALEAAQADSQKKTEMVVEAVQTELAKLGPASAAAPSSTVSPAVWDAVNSALGIDDG